MSQQWGRGDAGCFVKAHHPVSRMTEGTSRDLLEKKKKNERKPDAEAKNTIPVFYLGRTDGSDCVDCDSDLSLLRPVLGRVRESARKAYCIGDLRQLGMVNASYSDTYQYSSPIHMLVNGNAGVANAHWCEQLGLQPG